MTRYAALDTIWGMALSGLNEVLIVNPITPFSFFHTVGAPPWSVGPPAQTRKFADPCFRSSHVNGDPFAIVISISFVPSL